MNLSSADASVALAAGNGSLACFFTAEGIDMAEMVEREGDAALQLEVRLMGRWSGKVLNNLLYD